MIFIIVTYPAGAHCLSPADAQQTRMMSDPQNDLDHGKPWEMGLANYGRFWPKAAYFRTAAISSAIGGFAADMLVGAEQSARGPGSMRLHFAA